jgi:hypothetical protein
MEDFFKQFRRNLERRPAPVFEEQDWQEMEKRLDAQDKKRRPAIPVWWAFPLLLLSLGVNLYFVREINDTRSSVSAPETSRDTIYLTKHLLKTDTIYKTRILHLNEQALFADLSSKIPENRPPADSNFKNNNKDFVKTPSTEEKPSLTKNALETVDNQIIITKEGIRTRPATNQSMPAPNDRPPGETNPSDLQTQAFEDTAAVKTADLPARKQKKSLHDYWNYLRPSDFQVGASGGWAAPWGSGLSWQSGPSAGVYAAIVFSPRIQLWADAQYLDLGFASDRMDAQSDVPPVEPPSKDFVFLKAEARQPSLQYAAGLTYSFYPGRKFNPFVGLGYGLVSRFSYEVVYEFANIGTGIEWNVDKPGSPRAFFSDYGLLTAGFDRRLSKYWNLQLRANYRRGFGEKSKTYMPNLIGLQGIFIRTF